MKIREFFFTGFYSGYSPVAPGTAGSLVAMALYIAENYFLGGILYDKLNYINFILVVVLVYPCIKLCDYAEIFYKKKDPQTVVIDEVMGYWTAVQFLHFSYIFAVLAFILFRIFDIIKPWPARKLQDLHGGLGIMIDDYIAGLYALAVMQAVAFVFEHYGIILL